MMMDIVWENEWNTPLDDIRANYGISTYNSIFPVNLLELIDNAPLLQKLLLMVQLIEFHIQIRRTRRK